MPREVIVTIRPDGTVELKTEGFAGQACLEATKRLEDRLGTKTKDEPTEEFYTDGESQANRNKVSQ